MRNRAIAHITAQALEENNPAVTKIEEYLTAKCTDDSIAKKLLAEGKSLKELYENIRKNARKKAVGGTAVLTEEEVYQMADEYYGILNDRPEEKLDGEKVNILDFL